MAVVWLLHFMERWSWYFGMPLRYTGLMYIRVFPYLLRVKVMDLVYQYACYGILVMDFMIVVCLLHFMERCRWYTGMLLRYTGLMDIRVLHTCYMLRDGAGVSVCLLWYTGLMYYMAVVCLLHFMDRWSCYIGMPLWYTGCRVLGYLHTC